MVKISSPASPPPTPPPAPPPSPPAGVIYLEWTKCSAAWRGTTSVDITADGYLRKDNCDARLNPQGWQNIQADNDPKPDWALVINVEEVTSPLQGTARDFYTVDNVIAPPELTAKPEVVFCGLVPGPDEDTPPPVLGMMKRTRIKVPGSA